MRFFCVYVVLCRQRLCGGLVPPSKESYQLSVISLFQINSEWEQARELNPSKEKEEG
jgi:hypothetical protein